MPPGIFGAQPIAHLDSEEKKDDNLGEQVINEIVEHLADLRTDYFQALDRGDPKRLQEVLDQGFPVNFPNPVTGETALHTLAAGGARAAIRVLLAHKDCHFLARDKLGRLPSELAFLYGRDPALARLLRYKERKQAEAQGIKLTRRPRPA